MTSVRTRRRLVVSTALIVVLPMLVAACSSGGSTADRHTDRTAPATTTAAVTDTGLVTPETLPDRSFPSVADPDRDGSLTSVRVRATVVAEVDSPTVMVARPGHDDQLFLAERAGRVRLVTVDPDDRSLTVQSGALLDISDRITTDGEMGLLGLAFSPDGATLYLSYNLADGNSRIDAATVADRGAGPTTGPTVGPLTELLEVDQMGTDFHKGGNLVVDAAGLLYAGFGDGGPQNDEKDHARDPDLLLGKILRIDPDGAEGDEPYAIPPGNPFASGGGAPEIWLTGLRNPWRFSIDPANGDVWIADVGQDTVEEIDRLPGGAVSDGANMGWSGHEGTTVFDEDRIDTSTVPPIFEVDHADGVCSITGGVVYRGTRIPDLLGAYVYSDLCRAGVHALRATTPSTGIGTVTDERALDGAGDIARIISFATDADGEVYTLSLDGVIRRLDPAD